MSLAERWLLPDGVKEILPPEARQIELLRRRILDLFHGWGYDLVMPPVIEYIESLLTGTGNDLDLNTYKVTDRLTGRMMGLRADTTPQVARIDAHSLHHEGPTRLCYANSVLHTVAATPLASRSPLQIGAELYGHAGTESDLEVICLMLETLQQAGVEGLTLDLGHVGIYRQLVAQAGLADEDENELFRLLQSKSMTELQALLVRLPVGESLRSLLSELSSLNGGVAVLQRAAELFAGYPAVIGVLESLRLVADVIAQRFPAVTIYFDLAELRGYNYHTGLVFAAYAAGYGQAVAKGGRYDEIGHVFGRARPATGFSADLKVIAELACLPDAQQRAILAPAGTEQELLSEISRLRAAGERVVVALPDVIAEQNSLSCDRKLVRNASGWAVVTF